MDFNGLFKPYAANRPLTDAERERHLLQKQRLEVEPAYQLSVIRINSTFMEVVDKHFAWKGFLTSVFLLFCFIFFPMLIGTIPDAGATGDDLVGQWWLFVFVIVMIATMSILFGWVFKQDNFRFTHYPIRLNRKTRMVHVFRINGTVLSVPWDEVFFCIAALPQGNWEIQGHVLDKDGVTVKETFAFSEIAGSAVEREWLKRYWEFVRRYMEDGPSSVIGFVKFCMPFGEERETFKWFFHRVHALFGLLGLLLFFPIYPGRWLAMRTCKIPVWPDEIERVCPIDANDPYRKDASTNEQL